MITVIISSHALFTAKGDVVYGTGSAIADFLREKGRQYICIKHPIYGGMPTQIDGCFENRTFSYKQTSVNSTSLFLRSLQELISTLRILLKQTEKPTLFIGIDPLNALFGWIAKKLGRVDLLVFYTADYTPSRFGNTIFNILYHGVDRWVIKKADEVWNVSTRITQLRKTQGVPDTKNYFVPNTPAFDKIQRLKADTINRHELVFVATSAQSTDFSVIFQAIGALCTKYPDMRLKVIGLDNWKEDFKKDLAALGIGNHIQFWGRMQHDELLKIFCRASVGLALYSNTFSWTYYSDSMKARDYLACGLPVIMTDISSTAHDIQKAQAGFVIPLDAKELAAAINELFGKRTTYLRMRKNAIRLARQHDIDRILDGRFTALEKKLYA